MDYLPTSGSELREFAQNFAALIAAAPGTYALVPNDATQISTAVQDFVRAYEVAVNPPTRTAGTIEARNVARATMVAILRGYAMLIKRNRAVENQAKVDLGVGVHNRSRTRIPAPTSFPMIHIRNATPQQHELHFTDSGTAEKRGRPQGAEGVLLFCEVVSAGEPVPTNGANAAFGAIVTRTIYRMNFSAEDIGKRAYYFARWHTARGLLGPWSQVASMTIAG